MLRLLLALALALAAPAAFAQAPEAAPGLWTQADGRITLAAARIGFPVQAGAVQFQRAVEFSLAGQGLDNALQYRSPDGQVFATVYVYYPALAHAGLTAFATDDALRAVGGPELRALGARLVDAGGRPGVAIRADYANYLEQRLASSAAFVKAGHWIVKIRVSGPEGRRGDVERTMAALLEAARFEGEVAPRPPGPLEIGDCAAPAGAPRAALLPSDDADGLEEAVTGVLDGSRNEARELDGEALLTPRFGARWCVSTRARAGRTIVPILRAQDPASGSRKRTVLIATVGDSGAMIEVVDTRRRHRFVLFSHRIGRTILMGAFDSIPSDAQIVDLLTGADGAGGRARAEISHKADGNVEITLPTPATPAPRT